MAESKMKAGVLVPDKMILRLILNEFNSRGWVAGAPTLPYTLSSTATSAASASAGSPSILDSMSDPNTDHYSPSSFSDSPTASFLLDGFPRTLTQARSLDALIPINFVVHISTPTDIIIDRIANRWIHAPSGRVYNTKFNAPKRPGVDDVTGEPLTKRSDDTADVWKDRLATFEKSSQGLLNHYDDKGILWKVEGNSSDEITPKLFKEFEKRFL
jgi:adenylate kinase